MLSKLAISVLKRSSQSYADRALVGSALGALGAFLGNEAVNSDWFPSFPTSAPVGNKDGVYLPVAKPVPAPAPVNKPYLNPSLAPILSPSITNHKDSVSKQREAISSNTSDLTSVSADVQALNTSQLTKAGTSTFLQNMVHSKTSMDEVAFAVNAQSVIHAMTFATLDRNLEVIASALVALAQIGSVAPTENARSTVVNIPPVPAPIDYTQYYEKMASHADSAKVLTDHAQTEKEVLDIHGVSLGFVKPIDLVTMKDGALALEKADVNSIGAEHVGEMEDILDGVNLDTFRFLNFISVTEHLQSCVPDSSGNYPDFDWSILNGS